LLEEVHIEQNHQRNQAEEEGVCLLLALKDYCTLPEQLGLMIAKNPAARKTSTSAPIDQSWRSRQSSA